MRYESYSKNPLCEKNARNFKTLSHEPISRSSFSDFELFLSGKVTPVQGLRGVQIEQWESEGWKSAYLWAGFTLPGEWR
jgi:hypothetical protein